MVNKEQHVLSYNLGLIALMNGMIACRRRSAVTYTNQLQPLCHCTEHEDIVA